MIKVYRRWLVERGYALGICAGEDGNCGFTTAGPPAYVRAGLNEHACRHRPGGMVLTDYGARAGF